MPNPGFKRAKLFIDPKVQGALVLHVVLYWAVCLVTITLMLLCWRVATGPTRTFYTHFNDMWFHFGPALIASLLLLPLVIVDVVKVSNRFAGPLFRLRRSLRTLSHGDHVEPIEFRDGDYWQEIADEFNAVLKRVRESEASTSANRDEEEELVGSA